MSARHPPLSVPWADWNHKSPQLEIVYCSDTTLFTSSQIIHSYIRSSLLPSTTFQHPP